MPFQSISIVLYQKFSIDYNVYKRDISETIALERELTFEDFLKFQDETGHFLVSLRLPSYRHGIETVSSTQMKYFTVSHFIIINIKYSWLRKVQLKVPLTVWPKKMN